MLKCWNHSTTTRNNAVNYYQNLEEVPWHLGLKELKEMTKFSKSLKIVKISIKLSVFGDGLFERSYGGGGGGGDSAVGWWGQ